MNEELDELRTGCSRDPMMEKVIKFEIKTIIFAPLDNVGHVNPLLHIANNMKKRGHGTIFTIFRAV